MQDGHVVFEASCLGSGAEPIALVGNGRVLLAATAHGSIMTVAWPTNTPCVLQSGQQMCYRDPNQLHEGAATNLAGSSSSSSSNNDNSLIARVHYTPGVAELRAACSSSGVGGPPPLVAALAPPAHETLDANAQLSHTSAATTPRDWTGVEQSAFSPLSRVDDANSRSAANAEGGKDHVAVQELRLHGGRITAMRVLHEAGLVITAGCAVMLLHVMCVHTYAHP